MDAAEFVESNAITAGSNERVIYLPCITPTDDNAAKIVAVLRYFVYAVCRVL